MGYKCDPDAEMARLNSMRERVQRLRNDLETLKNAEEAGRQELPSDILRKEKRRSNRSAATSSGYKARE
jgi:hypothetical protein